MTTAIPGIRAYRRIGTAAVAGLAGMAMGAKAQPILAAGEGDDPRYSSSSETIDVTGKRKPKSPKYTEPLRDTPRSVTIIPQALIQETGAVSLTEALRTVPGITFGAGEGGNPVGDRPFLRGYDAQSSTFVDGVRDIGAQSREVFNIDSVEVIKGATGSYAGRGGAGGGIYINSKMPQNETFYAGSLGYGNADYKRATADINYAFGDGIAVRLNALGFDAGVPGRDAVHANRWGIAPSIAFGLDSKMQLTLSYYHLQTDDLPDSGIPYNNPVFRARTDGKPQVLFPGNGEPIGVDRNTFYGLVNRDFRREYVDMGTIRVAYDITDDLHLRNTTRYAETGQDYLWTQPDDSQGNIYFGYVWRRPNNRISDVSYLINQTDFYGSFMTGSVKHNFATGIEFGKEEGENDTYIVSTNGQLAAAYNRCATSGALNAIATYNCTTINNPNPDDPWVGTVVRANNPTDAKTTTKSFYAFDTIELTEQWQVNLGIRFDRYDAEFTTVRDATTNLRTTFKREDDLFNYQAAVVYKPVEEGAIYLSYATASTPAGNALAQGSDPNALSSTINANLKPEENKTLELGAKWDLLDARLALTGAVFQVQTTNSRITQTDGTVALAGEKRVRGFEVGLSGAITGRWQIFGGYTYLDAILVRNGGAGAAAGLTDGQPFPNTPKHSIALWTSYDVLPDLNVGFGANYMALVKGSTNPLLPKFVPSYWLLSAAATYKIDEHFDVQLNVQNLTDETYYTQAYPTHYATLGPGRSVVLTLNAKF